ncbi:hypothetical protein [Sorangium sp. So ce887]|uniref:hypothetical protein n=1 Tax=Sorangium sp. So ce887 TaxID=3133324 RepID=UPI003F606FDE
MAALDVNELASGRCGELTASDDVELCAHQLGATASKLFRAHVQSFGFELAVAPERPTLVSWRGYHAQRETC